jgi:PAS domain S-box-containing protein
LPRWRVYSPAAPAYGPVMKRPKESMSPLPGKSVAPDKRDAEVRSRTSPERNHKRIEETLRHSEENFRALFDSANDALFILDPEGNFIDVNRSGHKRLGYRKDELITTHISILVPPEFAGKVLERIAEVKSRGNAVFESAHICKDGSIMPVEINAMLIDYEGRKAIFSIVRDITKRKEAEKALLVSESRLKYAEQIAHLGYWEWDISTNQVLWSDELYRIYGYEPREISPDYGLIVDTMHPESRKEFLDAIDAALKRKRPFEMDYDFFRKDGTLESLHTIGKAYFDADGKPARMFGIVQDVTDQKRAQRTLRESEEKFRTIFDRANDGILIVNISTKNFSEANKTICDMLGYTREEIVRLGIENIHPAEDLPRVLEEFSRQMKGEKTVAENLPVMRKDGSVFYADICAALIILGGEPYGVGIFRDITERKRSEESLKARERQLAESQRIARIGSWERDLITGRVIWSDEMFRVLGLDPGGEEPRLQTLTGMMPEDDRKRFTGAVRETLDTNKPYSIDYRVSLRDGSVKTLHARAEVIRDEAGKPLIFRGTAQDVTQMRKIENALRSSRDFVESILDTVDEAFIVIDRDYVITMANNAYARQVDMPLKDIIGKHCHEISHQSSKRCFESGEDCSVRHCFETGEAYSCVHRHKSKDGSILYVETKAFPLKDPSGNVTSAIEVINNITDKHLLEEQILRTQKLEAVGLLAGGIAHDFNNLLQGVFGSISMAKLFSDKGGKAYAMIEVAEKALYQATNLTKQLLTFSKGGEPLKKVISLPSVVDDAARFALSGSNVDYRSSSDERLWPVEADEGQITQVINNIVLNACESMPEGGTVRIEMRNVMVDESSGMPLKKGKHVQVDIRDSGTGIPGSHLSKIFDPYFTTKKKGSGLGLATSYSIIRKHDGVITVSSELGAGSTFSIYLPASEQKLAAAETPKKDLVTGKGRILVMDDEELVRTIVGHMISRLGYDVDFAENGEEAIEQYSAAMKTGRPFDAVILDLTIRAGMGGEEAIRKLTELDPAVRAIVSSGFSDDDIVSNYRDYGFRAVLSKPYRIEALGDVLHGLLRGDD